MMPGPLTRMSVFDLALVAVTLALAALGTALVRRHALKTGLLDHPGERSSHEVPTPRGGGIAVAIAFAAALTTWLLFTSVQGADRVWVALVPPLCMVTAVGYLDDRHHISVRVRLAVHFSAAAWLIGWLGGMPTLHWPGQPLELGMAGAVIAVVGVAWCIHPYNFLDGLDGLAGTEALFVALAAAMLGSPESPAFLPLLLLAAATAGFLPFNWPPASIFLGDSGSGFLGLTLAGLLLVQHLHGDLPIGAGLILLGAFASDATATLVVRLLTGRRVHEAHRDHAYQHLAGHLGKHRPVTLLVSGINLFWLLPLATFAALHPDWSSIAALVAYAPLAGVVLALGAGRPGRRN
jgi:Fuc2NAc and GlcNAc transferase